MDIIFEELNIDKLSERINTIFNKLKREIEVLQKADNRQQTEKGNRELKTLTTDFQQLVQYSRNLMLNKQSDSIKAIANKIDRIWRKEIYPLIIEYDKCVDVFNIKHGTHLKHISDRTGNEVLKSVRTYFNY